MGFRSEGEVAVSGDSVDGDERKLADLGRRTVEMFTIAHIFGTKLQAAFQEEQSLRRQEELIREEEEARVAADERVQRKAEADKERRAKKKARAPPTPWPVHANQCSLGIGTCSTRRGERGGCARGCGA